MAASPRSMITDDLLGVSVRIKREAGVTAEEIQAVIDKFASQEAWQERSGGIGFPLVEDIPQENRGAFMAALAELMPGPEARDRANAERMISAADIWRSRLD